MALSKKRFDLLLDSQLPNLSDNSKTKLTSKKASNFLKNPNENFLTFAVKECDLELTKEILSIDKQNGKKFAIDSNFFETALKTGNIDFIKQLVYFTLNTADLNAKKEILSSISWACRDSSNSVKNDIRGVLYPNISNDILKNLADTIDKTIFLGDEIRFYANKLSKEFRDKGKDEQISKTLLALMKCTDESPIGNLMLDELIYVPNELVKEFLDIAATFNKLKLSEDQLLNMAESLVSRFNFSDDFKNHDLVKNFLENNALNILKKIRSKHPDDYYDYRLSKKFKDISYLLDNINLPNTHQDINGWNILHYAAYQNDADLFFKLLNNTQNADLTNSKTTNGNTFLEILIANKNTEILKRILTEEKYSSFKEKLFSQDFNLITKCTEVRNLDLLDILYQTDEGKNLIHGNIDVIRYAGSLSNSGKINKLLKMSLEDIDKVDFKALQKVFSSNRDFYKTIWNAEFLENQNGLDSLIRAYNNSNAGGKNYIVEEIILKMDVTQLDHILQNKNCLESISQYAPPELVIKIIAAGHGSKFLENTKWDIKHTFERIPLTPKLLNFEATKSFFKNNPELFITSLEYSKNHYIGTNTLLELLEHKEVKNFLNGQKRVAFFENKIFMNNPELVKKLLENGFEEQIREQRKEYQKGFLGGENHFGGKQVTYFDKVLKEKESLRKILKKELVNLLESSNNEELIKTTLFEIIRPERLDLNIITNFEDLELDSGFLGKSRSNESKTTDARVNKVVDELLQTKTAYEKIFLMVDEKDKYYSRFLNKKEYGTGRLNAVRDRFANAAKAAVTGVGEKGDMNVLVDAWNSACTDYKLEAFKMHLDKKSQMKFDYSKDYIINSISATPLDDVTKQKVLENLEEIEGQLSAVNTTNIERSRKSFVQRLQKTSTDYSIGETMFLSFMGVLAAIGIVIAAAVVLTLGVILSPLMVGGDDHSSNRSHSSDPDVLRFLGLRPSFTFNGKIDTEIPVRENFNRYSKSIEKTGKILNEIEKLIGEEGITDKKLDFALTKANLFIIEVNDEIKGVSNQYNTTKTILQR